MLSYSSNTLDLKYFLPILFAAATLHSNILLAQQDFITVGMASFYHDKFEGRKTASGEVFKQSKMTCAHRSLPFGTMLKVTNLENNLSVIVKVNDRGPYSKSRIIDVTKAAARKLDFVNSGHVKVQLELYIDDKVMDSVLTANDSISRLYEVIKIDSGAHSYTIKIGSFTNEDKLYDMIDKVNAELNRETFIQTVPNARGMLYRLYLGKFATRAEAEDYLKLIKSYYPNSFIAEIK